MLRERERERGFMEIMYDGRHIERKRDRKGKKDGERKKEGEKESG